MACREADEMNSVQTGRKMHLIVMDGLFVILYLMRCPKGAYFNMHPLGATLAGVILFIP